MQTFLTLPPHPRGFHLITDEIEQEIEENKSKSKGGSSGIVESTGDE